PSTRRRRPRSRRGLRADPRQCLTQYVPLTKLTSGWAVARFIYIDETGSVGKGAAKQPQLILVAVIVDEDKVKPLGAAMRRVAMDHLGWLPEDFEFHGNELWGRKNWWHHMEPPALIEAYEAAINLLTSLELEIAYSAINKAELHQRYGGIADENAYLL